jgi:putative CocE/NonD family hydrolase
MKAVTHFPHSIREIMTQWIPMPDGTHLAARIWLPVDAETNPVPAVREYLPYRRRDGPSHRDSVTQPYLAGHGYAAVRVDIRGTGDSEGLMLDEYDLPEQHDGVEVIAWLARQSWCSGNVGMWGISWGGFNALQVAALNPPALKAIIPMGFTHDRYNGDCHYMGGCMIEGNTSWGGTLFAGTSRPPDPAVVGERWREIWLERLENTRLPMEIWLRHQRRNAYWKPGSVCEDFSRIAAAVYAVSGWQDSYSRNVFPLIEHLRSPKKALVGPWAHGWPHVARPGPAIGFMQEAVRWWDHWLKGKDTGIMDEPMLRMWMGEWVKPAKLVQNWPGRWVSETQWPAPGVRTATFMLNTEGLREHAALSDELTIRSPQTTGLRAGYQCSYGLGPDLSDDQRIDDAQSLCFDTLPLPDRLEIAGEPELELDIRSDQPQALIAVRLCDVAPDGASLRVSYGLLNLSHRDSEEFPAPLVAGRTYRVKIKLCGMAYAFVQGHRIRVALSTAYWPIAWPSPATTTLSLATGTSLMRLPTRSPTPAVDDALASFLEPEGAAPTAMVETRPSATSHSQDRIEEHLGEGCVDLVRTRDRGAWRMTDTDVAYDATGELRFSIQAEDPLSALQQMQLTTSMGREGWNVRTEVLTQITSTAEAFVLHAKLDAWEGETAVFSRSWDLQVPRDNV